MPTFDIVFSFPIWQKTQFLGCASLLFAQPHHHVIFVFFCPLISSFYCKCNTFVALLLAVDVAVVVATTISDKVNIAAAVAAATAACLVVPKRP